MSETVAVELTAAELDLIEEALYCMEYWDYATELDLPRRNGQVFLPEDDPEWWRGMSMNDDIEVAVEQMRWIRQVIAKLRQVRQVEAP